MPSASASASAIEEDASDAVTLEWRAAATKDPNAADVSIVVAGKAEFLGTMDTIGDGDYGACRIIADVATKTYSRFQCGDTPGYHYYAATLGAGELVIKLVHGDFGDPHSEKSRLVKRIPVAGSRLVVRPYRARP